MFRLAGAKFLLRHNFDAPYAVAARPVATGERQLADGRAVHLTDRQEHIIFAGRQNRAIPTAQRERSHMRHRLRLTWRSNRQTGKIKVAVRQHRSDANDPSLP